MRVTILTQPRCKIIYKYLNIKILKQIYLFAGYKNTKIITNGKQVLSFEF